MATQTRNPTSDVSFTGTWTAAPRWSAVDDHPDGGNPITDGITHGTTAGEGLMGFDAFTVPTGSTGISVQVIYYDFKNGAQACNLRARLRCNDTTGRDAPGGTHNPGNGNANIALRTDDYGANNPKTGLPWTVDDVNGVGANGLTAFGVVSTDANPTITISSILLQVTYTEPSVTGDLASTEAMDTAAASGTVVWVADLAATEAEDSASASGAVAWAGSLEATEVSNTSASSGTVEWVGNLAATESEDVASASGIVEWVASLASTEAPDVAAFSGTVSAGSGISGDLAATEGADQASGAGGIYASGDLSATEASDIASDSGTVAWIGNLAAAETVDDIAASGLVQWSATLVTVEGADVVAFSDTVSPSGTFAATEGADYSWIRQNPRTRPINRPHRGLMFPG